MKQAPAKRARRRPSPLPGVPPPLRTVFAFFFVLRDIPVTNPPASGFNLDRICFNADRMCFKTDGFGFNINDTGFNIGDMSFSIGDIGFNIVSLGINNLPEMSVMSLRAASRAVS
jgi:hypothetical protein